MPFSRRDDGVLEIDLPEDQNVLRAFLRSDVGDDPESARRWIAAISDQVAGSEAKPLVGNGFAFELEGTAAILTSAYELFPETEYPVNVVLQALRELERFLTEESRRDS